jgi:lipid-A-disaccharide synthase-like uncharacterized protein
MERKLVKGFLFCTDSSHIKLGEIVELIYFFKNSRSDLSIPKWQMLLLRSYMPLPYLLTRRPV